MSQRGGVVSGQPVFYLGDYHIRGNFSLRCMMFYGDNVHIANFRNSDEYEAFVHDSQVNIRDVVDEIMSRSTNRDDIDNQLRSRFLPNVRNFIERWGALMVPQDIRSAVNDIEQNVGVPLTIWPPFQHAPRR